MDSACVQAPNVITPNGDGITDVFHVLVRNIVTVRMVIINSEGDTVHVSEDPNVGWNGTDTTGQGPFAVHVEALSTSGQVLQGTSELHALGYGLAPCLTYPGIPVCGDQLDPRICGPTYPTHEVFCE